MRAAFILFILSSVKLFGQFDPAGGEPGSRSVHRDHSSIYDWADSVQVTRGWQDIGDTALGKVDAGVEINGLGKADGTIISLGDGGMALVYFKEPIVNYQGADLAVFENGFQYAQGYFLELAFVEVSKDGTNFKRFPAISIADTNVQLTNADGADPRQYQNLAGKHQAPFGTLFDLQDIGMDSIHYVRITDVVGILNDSLGFRDSQGNLINDPYPTPFPQGGFDMDAVAALRGQFVSIPQVCQYDADFHPSLISSTEIQKLSLPAQTQLTVVNGMGQVVFNGPKEELYFLNSGTYVLQYHRNNTLYTSKLCVY